MSSDSLPPRVAEPGMSDEAMRNGSGKNWDEWFALLDAWDATSKTHTEIARYVAEEHSVEGWWAQGVTVGYERARGMRKVNETLQGFSGNASKTVPVPIEQLYAAFLDDSIRDQWLEPGTLTLRTAQENRSARFDIKSGGILEIWFTTKSESKSSAAVGTNGLPDQESLEAWRSFWKERLKRLELLLRSS